MAYLCILMGRRRAAFSRPFARPLASRLTDDESTEPTPRTLYSLLSLCLPSSLEITRDCTHTHTPPHQPAFYHIPPSLSLSVQAPRICPPGLHIPKSNRSGSDIAVASARVSFLSDDPPFKVFFAEIYSTLACRLPFSPFKHICTSNTAIAYRSRDPEIRTIHDFATPNFFNFSHQHLQHQQQHQQQQCRSKKPNPKRARRPPRPARPPTPPPRPRPRPTHHRRRSRPATTRRTWPSPLCLPSARTIPCVFCPVLSCSPLPLSSD